MNIEQLKEEFPKWETKVRVNPYKGCWEWLGTLDRDGYANGSSIKAPTLYQALYHHFVPGLVPTQVAYSRPHVNPFSL